MAPEDVLGQDQAGQTGAPQVHFLLPEDEFCEDDEFEMDQLSYSEQAGFDAFASELCHKENDPALAQKSCDITEDERQEFIQSKWINLLDSEDGQTVPRKSVVQDLKKMEALFSDFHQVLWSFQNTTGAKK